MNQLKSFYNSSFKYSYSHLMCTRLRLPCRTYASYYFCFQQNNPLSAGNSSSARPCIKIVLQRDKSRLKKPQYCKYLPPKLNHGLRVEGNLKRIRKNHIQLCLKRQLPLGKTHRQLSKKTLVQNRGNFL